MLTLTLYADETTNDPFIRRLLELEDTWQAKPGSERSPFPLCGDQKIRRNENGIGLEIDDLPLNLPPRFVDVPLRLVVIKEAAIRDVDTGDHLQQGTYRRGRASATVMRHTYPEGSSWKITVSSTSFNSAVKLYTDIRSGNVDPKVSFEANKMDDQQ